MKSFNGFVANIISKPICHLLLVILLGVIGYANTLNVPFQFDDIPDIVLNPIVKNLDYYRFPSKAKADFKDSEQYLLFVNRYVGNLTFTLNYKYNALGVTGYHLVNIVIHLLNAVFVYWLVRLLFISLPRSDIRDKDPFPRRWGPIIAFFSALFFTVHPIQTQAVTFIVQRFASLATLFCLISLTMYMTSRLLITGLMGSSCDHEALFPSLVSCFKSLPLAPVFYLISLLSAVLAMMTKEIAFTLPILIMLYEFLFLTGERKWKFVWILPFVLTMSIIPISLFYSVAVGGGDGTVMGLNPEMPTLDYLYTQFRVIITYIRLLLFPVQQNLDYDYPIYRSLLHIEVLLSLVTILSIIMSTSYLFWRFRKTEPLRKIIFFGMAWFFITLSVESTIVPLKDLIFEHRLYLPSIGFVLMVCSLSMMVANKYLTKKPQIILLCVGLVIALILTGVTYSRNNIWRKEVTLWEDVVRKSPEKERGYINLARCYYENDNIDGLIKAAKKWIMINPDNDEAYDFLGDAYFNEGKISLAIEQFEKSLMINPKSVDTHIYLGTAYGLLGKRKEATDQFQQALALAPDSAATHDDIGVGLYRLGLEKEATEEFIKALQINPNYTSARTHLELVESGY